MDKTPNDSLSSRFEWAIQDWERTANLVKGYPKDVRNARLGCKVYMTRFEIEFLVDLLKKNGR